MTRPRARDAAPAGTLGAGDEVDEFGTDATASEPVAQATERAAEKALQEPVGFDTAFDTVAVSLKTIWAAFLAHLPLIVAGFIVVLLTLIVARWGQRAIRRVVGRTHLRVSLRDLFGQLFYIAIWMFGILVAALVVFPGFQLGQIVAALGLGSIAIGFAFKDIFENFFAGILILWRFPFDPGDVIECEGIKGEVEDITIRMTLLREMDGQLVVLPNALLLKNPVRVVTAGRVRRVSVEVGVAYDTDLPRAARVIDEALRACPSVDGEHPRQVFVLRFGESSIDFELTWWTAPRPGDERRSRDEVLLAVRAALAGAGIEIPFPQRDVHLRDGAAAREAGAGT